MENKLLNILSDINAAYNRDFNTNIIDRLDKVLKMYLNNLDEVYDNVSTENPYKIIKELNK